MKSDFWIVRNIRRSLKEDRSMLGAPYNVAKIVLLPSFLESDTNVRLDVLQASITAMAAQAKVMANA